MGNSAGAVRTQTDTAAPLPLKTFRLPMLDVPYSAEGAFLAERARQHREMRLKSSAELRQKVSDLKIKLQEDRERMQKEFEEQVRQVMVDALVPLPRGQLRASQSFFRRLHLVCFERRSCIAALQNAVLCGLVFEPFKIRSHVCRGVNYYSFNLPLKAVQALGR